MGRNTNRTYILCSLILALGIFLSVTLFISFSNWISNREQKLIDENFNNIYNRLSGELNKNLDALYAMRAFYTTNRGFSWHTFSSFGSFYTDNIKSIQALEWVPVVPYAKRDSFEMAARAEGFRDFHIFTREGGNLVHAEKRDVYYPVYYIQPLDGNEVALGYDPGDALPEREAAIQNAITTGDISISSIVNIIQKSESEHKAILVFLPVYFNEQLTGFIEGVFLIDELIEIALEGLQLAKEFEIVLTSDGDEREVLYRNFDQGNTDLASYADLKVGNRIWRLQLAYVHKPSHEDYLPFWSLIISLLITLLITRLVYDTLNANARQLLRQVRELERKNTDLEQYAYVASHDLQEPLHTIQSLVSMIDDNYRHKLDSTGQQYISYLHQTTSRMSNLITSLLNYSRIGRTEEAVLVQTGDILEEVKKNLTDQIDRSGAAIHIKTDLPEVKGYPLALQLLFQNLLSNAMKFQPRNQQPIIHIEASAYGKGHRFSVQDNGIGIPEEAYQRIFLIFKRLHSHSIYQGTGVGLAQCKKIVEMHEGSIWVNSEEGKGSTFYFTLNLI